MVEPTAGSGRAPESAWWPLERFLRRYWVAVWAVVLGLLIANEFALWGRSLRRWDWLFVTGVVALLVTLRLAAELPDRVEQALVRLALRGVLLGDPEAVAGMRRRLHARARRLSVPWAAGLAVVMVIAWVAARGGDLSRYALTVVVEAAGAALAGLVVGRAVGYGLLGRRIKQAGLQVLPEPQDFDGAAGLRPIGHLYFFQASVVAVPAAFVAVWWFVIPVFGQRYLAWRNVYAGLMVVVIALEVLAFAAPMISFHAIMRDAKMALLVDADRYNQEAAGLREKLIDATGPDRETVTNRLAWLQQRYTAIEAMPEWPIDLAIRRRFTLNTGLLLLPVAFQAVGLSGPWADLVGKLASLGS